MILSISRYMLAFWILYKDYTLDQLYTQSDLGKLKVFKAETKFCNSVFKNILLFVIENNDIFSIVSYPTPSRNSNK